MQVYSPYILINKTGCEFALKTKTFMSSAKNVAGQEVFSGEGSLVRRVGAPESDSSRYRDSRSQAQGSGSFHVLLPYRRSSQPRPAPHQGFKLVDCESLRSADASWR